MEEELIEFCKSKGATLVNFINVSFKTKIAQFKNTTASVISEFQPSDFRYNVGTPVVIDGILTMYITLDEAFLL